MCATIETTKHGVLGWERIFCFPTPAKVGKAEIWEYGGDLGWHTLREVPTELDGISGSSCPCGGQGAHEEKFQCESVMSYAHPVAIMIGCTSDDKGKGPNRSKPDRQRNYATTIGDHWLVP